MAADRNKLIKGIQMQKIGDVTKAIGYIDIRVFAHATENQGKVETATKNLFPQELTENIVFQKTVLSGHHSNSIIMLTTRLADRKLLPAALEKIGGKLSTLDKQQLNDDIKLHLENGNLYLRFDKQAAYLGHPKLMQNDPIHVKVHFKNKTNDKVVELAQQFGLLL
ncbi:MAG: RNA-binding domain-containing protein [Candidatus Bathyarchaeia archaeon]|jgi:RNA binding exosome subunit